MKRLFLLFTICMIAVTLQFSFAGGEQEDQKGSDADGTVSLDFWIFANNQTDAWNEIIDTYMSENPGVSLSFKTVPRENWESVLTAALLAEEGPDMFATDSGAEFLGHVEKGNYLNLSPYMDKEWQSSYFDATKRLITYDGNFYAIPFAGNNVEVFYDKKYMDGLGLSFPKTLDDFANASKKIEAEGSKTPYASMLHAKGPAGFLFLALAGGNNPELLLDANSGGQTELFEREDFQIALENFKEYFIDTGYYMRGATGISYDAMNETVAQGKVAMYYQGTWATRALRGFDDEYYHQLDVKPFPAANASEEPAIPTGLAVTLGVSSGCENPEAAADFMRWVSYNRAHVFVEKIGLVPVNDLVPMEKIDEIAEETNNHLLKNWVNGQLGKTAYNVDKKIFNAKVAEAVLQAMQGVYLGEMTPEEAHNVIKEAATQ